MDANVFNPTYYVCDSIFKPLTDHRKLKYRKTTEMSPQMTAYVKSNYFIK